MSVIIYNMVTFYFLRHGKKQSIPWDPPLTELGLRQAETTAEFLKTIPFKSIISSQKLRTQQTAKAVAEKMGIEVIIDKRLQERLEWEGDMSFEEFLEEWWKTDRNRKYKPEKGESSQNKGFLMRGVIDEISEKYKEGNFLIVTHGGSIGDLLRNLFTEEKISHKTDFVSGTRFVELTECSLTIIQRSKDKFKLIQLNSATHLSNL